MTREISIHEDAEVVLRDELRYLVDYFRGLGHEQCEVVFGWHWGMDYPPGAPWHCFHLPLSELETEVRKPENAGFGEFGRDDITITVPPLDCEFLFCHHSGIHLTFAPPARVAEEFAARWAAAGFAIVERECASGP